MEDFLEGLGFTVAIIGATFVFILVIGVMVNNLSLYYTEKKIDMLQEKNLLTNETIDILLK